MHMCQACSKTSTPIGPYVQVSSLLQDLNNRMHLAADAAVYNKRKEAAAEAAAAAAAMAAAAAIAAAGEDGGAPEVEMQDQHPLQPPLLHQQQQQQQQQQQVKEGYTPAMPSFLKQETGAPGTVTGGVLGASHAAPSISMAHTATTPLTAHAHTSSMQGGGTEARHEGARDALLARHAAHEGSAPLAIMHSVLRDVSVAPAEVAA
eukprot:1157491-Pelagomonas_calceolata.AAC.5